jgi:hypothetical protein
MTEGARGARSRMTNCNAALLDRELDRGRRRASRFYPPSCPAAEEIVDRIEAAFMAVLDVLVL